MINPDYLYAEKAAVRTFLFFKKTYKALDVSPRKAFDSLMNKMPESHKRRATYTLGIVRRPDCTHPKITAKDIQWYRGMSFAAVMDKYKDWE